MTFNVIYRNLLKNLIKSYSIKLNIIFLVLMHNRHQNVKFEIN